MGPLSQQKLLSVLDKNSAGATNKEIGEYFGWISYFAAAKAYS